MPTHTGRYWEENPLESPHRVNLNGLSIYQPQIGRGQGRIPRFLGIFTVFLETHSCAVAGGVYILWVGLLSYLLHVVFAVALLRNTWICNLSTTDGTKVRVRGNAGGMPKLIRRTQKINGGKARTKKAEVRSQNEEVIQNAAGRSQNEAKCHIAATSAFYLLSSALTPKKKSAISSRFCWRLMS